MIDCWRTRPGPSEKIRQSTGPATKGPTKLATKLATKRKRKHPETPEGVQSKMSCISNVLEQEGFVFRLLPLLLLICSTTLAETPRPQKVWLLAGQSNMIGWVTDNKDLPPELRRPQAGVKISTDGRSWVDLAPGFGPTRRQFGLELTFPVSADSPEQDLSCQWFVTEIIPSMGLRVLILVEKWCCKNTIMLLNGVCRERPDIFVRGTPII